MFIDEASQFLDPPKSIPKWLINDFTYNGKIALQQKYYNESENHPDQNWTMKYFEEGFKKHGFVSKSLKDFKIH